MVDDHHRELNTVFAAEVDALATEDLVDRVLEVLQLDQADEMRDLVQAVGSIERPELPQLFTFRQSPVGGRPITGDFLRVLLEKRAELPSKGRTAIPVASARIHGIRQRASRTCGPRSRCHRR